MIKYKVLSNLEGWNPIELSILIFDTQFYGFLFDNSVSFDIQRSAAESFGFCINDH